MCFSSTHIELFLLNPLTPVPAITGRAKTQPQFPVLALTGRKKAHEDNCLPYPPWRHFGSPIVLLLLGTNKPMRMDLLSIFLEGFRGPRKTGFCLKIMRSKSAVIMAHCGPNLQTSRVLFSFLKGTNYFLALQMERKNKNRCLGGLRMEDQGERRLQSGK